MSSSSSSETHLDLTGTFGISYIGAMVAMVLYGITTLQSYLYFMYYPKDRPSLKLLVTFIWVLETFQIALVCHSLYHYLHREWKVINYSNPLALVVGTWSLFSSILINVIISTTVQLFFAVRVHILSKGMWWLTILILVAVLAHFGFGLETVILLFKIKLLSKFDTITYNAALPFSITAVFPDVLIAFSLCYFLHSVKSGFRGTNALLNTLMVYAVNRCLLTTVVVIVEVILFKVLPDSFYFLAVDFCVGKLYANTLLATLNTRQSLRGRGYESDSSQSFSGLPPSSHGATPQFRDGVPVHAQHSNPLELTDLRATWPSGFTHDTTSADSAHGVRSDLHRKSKKDNKDPLGIAVHVDVESDVEAQKLSSEKDPSQKHVPLGS